MDIKPKSGDYVEHYKGGNYRVLHIAKTTSDLSEQVVYYSLKDGSMWIRPLSEFMEKVKVDSGSVDRFKLTDKGDM